ncbi:MAG: hypothetical protein CFE39_15155 [Comamonadaceae bacterium PBBC2]|nr:MAG: hypothetical protein CFE39_15155 [Comamonadaceae bacterium PBBC2]
MTIQKISPIGAYVFERGGLSNSPAEGAEPVDHFDFCPNCETEVPVDEQGVCMHCYKVLPTSEEM